MKTKKVLFIWVYLISTALIANAQLIDNYGFKFSYGVSNQNWSYQNSVLSDLSGWKTNKNSFVFQLFAEKNIGQNFVLNCGLGYLQNGFTEQVDLTFYSGETAKIINDKVSFHNLNFDLSLKYKLNQNKVQPYLFTGISSNYLIDYKTAIVEYQGTEYNLDTEIYDGFNKITLGGIIGFGLSYKNKVFAEFEYKPAITNNLNNQNLTIKSRYVGLVIGLNINDIINKQKK
ncbi:MAG: PorT family protein [Bacteroidales bacterium]|nr:PorT family protein [Bacteroidales bacterium]